MKCGKSTVLIGLQYGDEGKARVLDKIGSRIGMGVVARFNGGSNAGHTLNVGEQNIALHMIPSGIFYPESQLYVGSGCVVNPVKVKDEISDVSNLGINLEDRLFISSNAPLVQPHHILLDGIHGGGIGTTNNGIGPCYADVAVRAEGNRLKNVQFGTYLTDAKSRESVRENLDSVIEVYQLNCDPRSLIQFFDSSVQLIARYCCFDPLFLEKQVRQGKDVFFEGAQSVLLDSTTGNVPFVTSSRTIAAAAYVGGDLPIKYHDRVIGVAKAVMSRVGNGPFISEFGGERSEQYCAEEGGRRNVSQVESGRYDINQLLKSDDLLEVGIGLRMLGREYGATTKRPRRIGMLDLVMLGQTCRANSVDELYLNKFDCLVDYGRTSLGGIPFVAGYILDGTEIDFMPTTQSEFRRVQPIIEKLPCIKEDLSGVRNYEDLPREAKNVVHYIEEKVGTKIYGLGVGPERDQFIARW